MSTLHSSLESVMADLKYDNLVFVITGWKPYNAVQFIRLLQGQDYTNAPNQKEKFCVTRIDHPDSQDEVVFVSVADYEPALKLCHSMERTEKDFIFFFLVTPDSLLSVNHSLIPRLISATSEKFSASVVLIPPEKYGAQHLPSPHSSSPKAVSWIKEGLGFHILRYMSLREAWGLVDAEIARSMGGFGSQLQEEMMILKLRLYETEEGVGLSSSFQNLLREEKSTLKRIQDSLETTDDRLTKDKLMEELKDAYILYTMEIQELLEKMVLLGVKPGGMIVNFFQGRMGF